MASPATSLAINPNPNPILAKAEAATERSSKAIDAYTIQQEAIAAATTEATSVAATAQRDKAVADAIVQGQANIVDLQQQNTVIDTFEGVGGVDFQRQLLTAYKKKGEELLVADKEYESAITREATGIFDYFARANEQHAAALKANAIEDSRDNIGETLQGLNSAQASVAKATAAAKKTMTTATIEATARSNAASSAIIATTAELKGLALNSQMVARSMAASSAQASAQVQVYQLSLTAEGQALRKKDQEFKEKSQAQQIKQWDEDSVLRGKRLEQLELQLAETKDPLRIAALTAQREDTVKKFKDQAAFDETYVAAVQRGQAAVGGTIDTPEVILTLRNKDVVAKRKYDKFYSYGSSEVGEVTFGSSPADAAVNLEATGSTKTAPVKILDTLHAEYIATYADGLKKPPKDQLEAKSAFNSFAESRMKFHAGNIKEGDATNPYQAPPMSVLAQYAGVKDSVLYKTVLEPMGMAELSPKGIFDAAIAGVQAGNITIAEAAMDIEGLFKTAAIHNSESKMFRRIGLENQTSYNTQVVDAPVFGSGDIGAAGGGVVAGIGTGVLVAAGATPPGWIASGILLGGGAVAGASLAKGTHPQESLITNAMDRTQVTQALIKLMSIETSITGNLY